MVRRLNDLPEEIIFQILTRLPTESALDCKLVCKLWRDLVLHPSFSQMHLKHLNCSADGDSGGKVSIIFNRYNPQQRRNEIYYTEFGEICDEIRLCRKTRMNLSPEFQNCNFVGSCNGLICFNSLNLKLDSFGPAYISNPITREYIILPVPDLGREYQWNGFGYSASTNEYKVVRICFTTDDLNFGVAQVYTVGGGNGWRNLGEMGMNWKYMKSLKPGAGMFANEALYWVNKDNGAILAFDLTDEKFSELPSPPPPSATGDGFIVHLGVLGDFLSVTYFHSRSRTSEIWLQKKNEDNSGLIWNKQFTFGSYIWLLLSKFRKSGKLLCYRCWGIYCYDPKVSLSKIDVGGISMSEAIPHMNTLVSLKALGEKDTKTMEFGERARSSEVVKSST